MTKVKTSLRHEYGKSRNTSFGKLVFDESGIAKVDSEFAEILTSTSASLMIVGEWKAPDNGGVNSLDSSNLNIDDTPSAETIVDAPPVIQEDVIIEEAGDLNENLQGELEALNIGDLRDLLTKGGVDSSEFAHFKGKEAKPELVKLVIEKKLF